MSKLKQTLIPAMKRLKEKLESELAMPGSAPAAFRPEPASSPMLSRIGGMALCLGLGAVMGSQLAQFKDAMAGPRSSASDMPIGKGLLEDDVSLPAKMPDANVEKTFRRWVVSEIKYLKAEIDKVQKESQVR